MKTSIWLGAFALALSLLPLRTHAALLSNPEITQIVKIDPNTCAIGVKMPDTLGLPFNLGVGGNVAANLLTSLTGLSLQGGDSLLLATPSFESLFPEAQADIAINESVCSQLNPGSTLQLLTSGLGTLDSVTLPDGFDDLTGVTRNTLDDALELLDLTTAAIDLSNSDGGTVTVGPVDEPSDSGEGSDGETGEIIGSLPEDAQGGAAAGGCSIGQGGSMPAWPLGLLGIVLAASAGRRSQVWAKRLTD